MRFDVFLSRNFFAVTFLVLLFVYIESFLWSETEISLFQKEENEFGSASVNETEISLFQKENEIGSQNLNESSGEKEVWGYVLLNLPLGGLGDRFRAAIGGYYIALLTNRALKIDGHAMWGSEDDYFDTNTVNWKISEETGQVIRSSNTTRVEERIGHHDRERFQELNFDRFKGIDVFVFHTNTIYLNLLAENPSLRTSPKFEFFNDLLVKGLARSYALTSLFQPGKKILPYLENFQREYWPTNDTLRIGMHLRSGDNEKLLSKSRKRRYVVLERAECFASKAISIWEEKKKGLNEYKNVIFFVASDLVDLEEIVMKKIESQGFKIFRNNNLGESKHIHLSKADQIRTFVDWWTLTRMDILLFSKSGFSESAVHFSLMPSFVYHNNPGPCEAMFKPFDRTTNMLFF